MKPPGKTTLMRMQLAAYREAERIEITQDARVLGKLQAVPREDQVLLRDDFAGIVRLIDVINSDAALLDRVIHRLKTTPSPVMTEAAAAAEEEVEASE